MLYYFKLIKRESDIMIKRIIAILLIALIIFTLCSCGGVTLHCDGCGKEVRCRDDMTEEWIIFCSDCEKDLDPTTEAE